MMVPMLVSGNTYLQLKILLTTVREDVLTVQKLLQNQRWIQGPNFLYQTEDQWPTLASDSSINLEDDPEVKTVKVNATAVSKPDDPIIRLLTYHSSWYKLKKSVAWILKIKN